MPKALVSIVNFGPVLWKEVLQYMTETGQPMRPDIAKSIYDQVFGQCVLQIKPDLQAFSANLLTIPQWSTLHYTDEPVNYERVRPFAAAVRAFGVQLWHLFYEQELFSKGDTFVLESCDSTTAVIGCYYDNAYL